MSFSVQHPLEHDIEPSMNNVYGHICPSPISFIDLTNFSLRLRSWICSRPLTVVCPWLQLILPILYVWDDLTSCIKYMRLTVTQFPGEKCTNIGKAVNALKRKMHHISMGKLNEQSLCNKFSVSLIRLSYFVN